MAVTVEFFDVAGVLGETSGGVYAVVVAYGDAGADFCLKGIERTGKTSRVIADELEAIAIKLRGGG